MALRVRVSTIPPLPPLKVWYPLPHLEPPTIHVLKTTLLNSIPVLSNLALSPERLSLHIDQYALLEHSDISILREGDLLSLAQTSVESHVPITRKRKFSIVSSTTSSSSSTSSESSSSNVSSSSSSPSQLPSKPLKDVTALNSEYKQVPASLLATVPPGQGKLSTHQRNIRRRKKRLHQSGINTDSNQSSKHDLSSPPESQPVHGLTPSIYANLHNKNKRKGFKQFMLDKLPQRTVFESPSNLKQTSANGHLGGLEPARSIILMPTVAPSERTGLPSNIFVTSVDVEENNWSHSRKQRNVANKEATVVPINERLPDVRMVEKTWDSLPKVTADCTLSVDMLLAGKFLDIDPQTLTPQTAVMLGIITSVENDVYTVKVESTSGLRNASFGGFVEDQDTGDDEDEAEILSLQRQEMIAADWRIVHGSNTRC